ncbi:PhnA domain-containing protein [Microbulbifer thermotolerans]|uniref:PhnA domain-containing protein n=1 Tax=Microbulbifer thermotolerans TaxID=252514 RepID=UPI002248C838|nr:alkylphosphonate utilization protein [Microbulbifer thermotolerans]MCX2778111.1 PhnA domain-containing protein [Microbulbifer thermotolerans]MCX2806219.1 PhnA domain-containing protein [Microbulbifer thermotolerans]MCX2832215.1 PhnA domain-containing protein [Microbulbifer thermotolerans]
MSSEQELVARSGGKCELCSADNGLALYSVPASEGRGDADILLCQTCRTQLDNPAELDASHWHCLSDSMWSQVPAVQIMAWRLLKRFSSETWAQDLLDMLYLDDDMLSWAQAATLPNENEIVVHRDCNGVQLQAGDTVTIIKDLDVKGTSIVAKRGTAVRGISLTDNPEQIEGRVEGQRIVILTKFVRKSS